MNTPLRPPKLYRDSEFMHSPDARSLRILSEYLGPLSYFHREKIKDTIVFFGSARAIPKSQAEEEYRALLTAGKKRITLERRVVAESAHVGAQRDRRQFQLRLVHERLP